MPSSISYSSILPKFPDKQRRPGLIQLPQALPKPGGKPSALNGLSKQSSNGSNTPDAAHKLKPQLPTPSPSPASRSKSQQARRKQKRSSMGNIIVNIGDNSEIIVGDKAVAPLSSSATSGPIILSPPPTPAQRATNKASSRSKSKNRAAGHARQSSKSLSFPVSPPLTPEAFKVNLISIQFQVSF